MTLVATLLNIIVTYNEVFWLYQWVNVFLYKKTFALNRGTGSKFPEWIIEVIYVAVVLGLNHITLTSPYTVLVIMVMNLVCVLCFWKSDVIQVFSIVGGYFLALFAIGNIEISLTGVIGGEELIQATAIDQGTTRIIYMCIGIVVWYLINKCAVSYVKK